jgi:hypothetical protein
MEAEPARGARIANTPALLTPRAGSNRSDPLVTVDMGGVSFGGAHTGSAPSPFEAVDGYRLAGSAGSHPLHFVSIEELVRPTSGEVEAQFAFDDRAVVGQGITGKLRLTGMSGIAARSAALRLVGLKLVEQKHSREDRDSQGNVGHTEEWIEAEGSLFVQDAFPEPPIPPSIGPGETWEARFAVPAPTLGPPTAHLGEAIVAWALEVRWDVAHGHDSFAAIGIPISQHPDLLRAGVGKQGGVSLMETVSVEGATIAITTPLPAALGSEIGVHVAWPGAPGGRQARIELHRRTNAPNGVEGIVSSAVVASDALRAGSADVSLLIPADAPPSFDGAGLEIRYVIRVLVDRRLRPDAAVERPVGVA